jgi:AcrR family transcriptional regulator
MQATAAQSGRQSRTFTEQARRAQIVDAAISTIAEVGYRKASFAQIAQRAGLSSTGLISYHFAGRDELIREVVGAILADIGAFMANHMTAVTGPAEALRAYIEGNVAYISAHGEQMKALMDIFLAGGFRYDADAEAAAVSPLEEILRTGQAAGDFRDFDPSVMAVLVQRAIDGLPFLLDMRPDLDIAAYGREVVTVFDLATRAEP